MDFEHFLVGLSHFNSPGRKEEKMKTAFRLHDADDDGLIKFEDMMVYVKAITLEGMDGISYFLSFVYSTSRPSSFCQLLLISSYHAVIHLLTYDRRRTQRSGRTCFC